MQAPLIDKRDYQALVDQTSQLAQELSGWWPRPDEPDAGQAIIRIFGRMAELVVERINRAPEKNYLAFLNLIGTQMVPPLPARVPLTFQLAANSPVDALIPAGTQVAAPPVEGEEDEVLFETERTLIATRAQLQTVIVGDTETDSYSDRTAQAIGEGDEPFEIFTGDQRVPHQLFIACDDLLARPGLKDVMLVLRSPDTIQWTNWPISWAYWDGTTWQPANSSAQVQNGAWRVTLRQLPKLPLHLIHSREASWLRAQLDMPLPSGESGLSPDSIAMGGQRPANIEFPLFPFGQSSDDNIKFFYLSADDAIAPGSAVVTFNISLTQPGTASRGAANVVKLNWSYRVGNEWRPLGQSTSSAAQTGTSEFNFSDGTQALTQNGEIRFHVPAIWTREFFRTRQGRWLRVEVSADGGSYNKYPQLVSLTVSYGWELPRVSRITVQLIKPPEAVSPVAAYGNANMLDLTRDFYPFGEQPRFNDTFYMACPEALAKPRAAIQLAVTLTNPKGTTNPREVYTAGGPRITWEAWNGQSWVAAAASDTAYVFTGDGTVTLTLPDRIVPITVNGEERVWLRARLIGGHYGEAATYREKTLTITTNTNPPTTTTYPGYEPVLATFAPPVIKKLTLAAIGVQVVDVPLSACLSYNAFLYQDLTQAAADEKSLFTPFSVTREVDPALYLGFDRPFDPRPVTLYFQPEPPLPEEVAADQLAELDSTTRAQLTWEYSGPDGWLPLGAIDETQTLANRGLITFSGPRDHTKRACYGRESYWLRLRWLRGYFPVTPRLRSVRLNTTWAAQRTSVQNEILGSSNSNPGQVFKTAQAPVLPDQQVVIREREPLAPTEQEALMTLEGADAITVTQDAVGQPEETWVRWHAVPDFYHSGPRDRHYAVDALTGEIRFGDGQTGMIPPLGQNNVRITYRTGGGEQGNRAAETIVQLKSGIPYIDGVINYEPAQGGAPREPLDRLKVRGSRVLRHRDRAVTTEDLADLAYAASAEIARAVTVSPNFDPYNLWLDPKLPGTTTDQHEAVNAGRIGVIVVPNVDIPRPTPTLGLLRQVESYLQQRCPLTADIWVTGPEWVRVTVTTTVVPESIEVADAVSVRVRSALERFLHPLTGGAHGQGWAFGRKPHRSDLLAIVEAVEGVDHVRSLSVALEPESQELGDRLKVVLNQSLVQSSQQPPAADLRRWLDRALVYSGPHAIALVLEPV